MYADKAETIFEERWRMISGGIDQLIERFSLGQSLRDSAVFIGLLRNLKSFTEAKFQYHLNEQLPDSPVIGTYPRAYALSLTLDQVAHDMRLIGQAAFQRLLDQGQGDINAALRVGERIAYESLRLAKDALFLPSIPKPLVYFQKSASIRVIPYADVALIAIPYSCAFVTPPGSPNKAGKPSPDDVTDLGVKRDFLAIPHEVGHYTYWKGRDPREANWTRISTVLSIYTRNRDPKWDERWVEEVFADVFGCRVAGALITQDFQDMQLEGYAPISFVVDDDSHPIPLLRPEIYTTTLSAMGFPRWSANLLENWNSQATVKSARELDGGPEATAKSTTLKRLVNEVNTVFKGSHAIWPSAELAPGMYAEAAKGLAVGGDPQAARAKRDLGNGNNGPKPSEMYEVWNSVVTSLADPAKRDGDDLEVAFARPWEGGDPAQAWRDWVSPLVEESKRKDLFRDARADAEHAWCVSLSAGGWTEGPQDDAPRPH